MQVLYNERVDYNAFNAYLVGMSFDEKDDIQEA